MKLTHAATSALALALASGCAADDTRIKTLIITGHNNHNWQYTSRYHKDTLEATGLFKVDITDSPSSTLADTAKLAGYKVFVLDYNDSHDPKRWGKPAEDNFVAAVRNGTGVVSLHSANNAFKGWTDYEQMIGLMWRDGTGHGSFHDFDVTITDTTHPIMQGLSVTNKTSDELYHKLVNSQNAKFTLLAQAMSTKESGGTGENEPMAFTLQFGNGRVFHTPLGHVWTGSDSNKASISTPIFKAFLTRGAEWAATGKVTLPAEWKDVADANTLTEQEKADGWTLLYDGKSAPKFKGYKQAAWPKEGWTFDGGAIRHNAGKGGGDIVTVEDYKNFEFAVDWKVAKGANSGIMYRVSEDQDYTFMSGPEMQILDNTNHQDGKKKETSAGALYGLYPASMDVWRPAGEWNHAKLKVTGMRVECWLNGFKVAETDMGGQEWKDKVQASKFKEWPLFGKNAKGKIALQDHGDDVWFRAVKVRKLPD